MDKGFCMVCGKEIHREDIHTISFIASYKGLGAFRGIIHGICAKTLQTEEEKQAFRNSEKIRRYNERCVEHGKKKGTRKEWEEKEKRRVERELKRKFHKALTSGVLKERGICGEGGMEENCEHL